MSHIDIKNKQYYLGNSKYGGNIDFMTAHNLFYTTQLWINIPMIVLSNWNKEEFLEFIKISKTFEPRRLYYRDYKGFKYCLNDLDKKLDKYLYIANSLIIKSIIE